MNNLNSILIEGNVTKDPEIFVTSHGSSLCKFPIASNRIYRSKEQELLEETSFIIIETWGPLAEHCGTYLLKGKRVRIVGRLKQERWQNEENQMRERFVIVAEHVEFQNDQVMSSQQEAREVEDEA
ncbi:MAG: single-stranded DNA-binding protein [Spirochaetia bacterium]|nr:single-stranded DNA-binding protein [Spirochaetia bacterium]